MADNSKLSRVYGVFQVCADPSSTNKTTGLLLPQLTTAQAQALATASPSVIQDGYIYYDTDEKSAMLWSNGAWGTVSTGGLTGEFKFPTLAATVESSEVNQIPGYTYYNTTAPNNIRTYIGLAGNSNRFGTIPASPLPVGAGAGLIAGCSPFALPTGPSASVEAIANQYNGFIYYNSTPTVPNVNTVRGRIGGAWASIYTTTNTAVGTGLGVGNSILALPIGQGSIVEGVGANNNQDGFMYHNAEPGGKLRVYLEGWRAISISTSCAPDCGTGLTNGNPFTIPYGLASSVETAAGTKNHVEGFMYYDTGADVLRLWVEGAWKTITPV